MIEAEHKLWSNGQQYVKLHRFAVCIGDWWNSTLMHKCTRKQMQVIALTIRKWIVPRASSDIVEIYANQFHNCSSFSKREEESEIVKKKKRQKKAVNEMIGWN